MSGFELITSRDNDIVKLSSQLVSNAKFRREQGKFVLDGLRLCKDAVLNNFPIDCFLVSESAFSKFEEDARFIAQNSERACIVPNHIVERISDTTSPQGFICVCSVKENNDNSLQSKGLYIALENMQDPSNLGAVARTAEALGIDGIIISKNSCDAHNPKALRASMGALLRIPIITVSDFKDFITNTRLKTYASIIDTTAKDVRKVEFEKGSIVLIGNEANGLTKETISVCDQKITIRMAGKSESLNAASAAAIIMWEMVK